MNKPFSLLLLILVISVSTFQAIAQTGEPEDKSLRPSLPAIAQGTIQGVNVIVDYSQPSAKGRKMLGGIEPYGTVWRTGANETTTIEFDGPVKIEGEELAAGKYALFTIPGSAEWTIIINTGIHWGAFDYSVDEDVLRVKVTPAKTKEYVETFRIAIENRKVVMRWEDTEVAFRIMKGEEKI